MLAHHGIMLIEKESKVICIGWSVASGRLDHVLDENKVKWRFLSTSSPSIFGMRMDMCVHRA
jgi:hypothetical protein